MKKIFALFLGALSVCCLAMQTGSSMNAFAETESAVNVYAASTSLVTPPSVVMEYNDGDDLSAFSGKLTSKFARPTTMIVEVDGNMQLVSEGEKTDYDAFRKDYIDSKMLAAVRVETQSAADALIEYISQNNLTDFSVVSSNGELVKKVRDACPKIRGVVDYSKNDISSKNAGQIVNEVNANKALTVIFDLSQVDAEFVFDVQARFKSVWVRKAVKNEHDVFSAIASGAVGIVADDYELIYDTYSSVKGVTLSRGFYGIGHRGLPTAAGENTLESMIAAYEAGATHLEVDARVCKSGEIVIMHDETMSTTTNGTGNVRDLTLDEIRQYQVVKNSNGIAVAPCQIPTLEEVFDYFNDKDIIIVVETKATQEQYPALLSALIKKYDMADQVVIIGFGLKQLELVRDQLPEIATANLNDTTQDEFLSYIANNNELNTVIDVPKGGFIGDTWLTKNSLARGYLPYCWTFGNSSENERAISNGCVGITTNSVDTLGVYAKKILTKSITVSSLDELDESLKIEVETYSGKKQPREASVISYNKVDQNTVKAILVYDDYSYNRFTEEIIVNVDNSSLPNQSAGSSDGSQTEQSSSGKGCNGSLATLPMLTCALLLGSSVIFKKQKTR